jgi:hypothetical protein
LCNADNALSWYAARQYRQLLRELKHSLVTRDAAVEDESAATSRATMRRRLVGARQGWVWLAGRQLAHSVAEML